MAVREPGSGSGAEERPVPRDLPDQQAGPAEDPWDVSPGHGVDVEPDDEQDAKPDEDVVPDTDEAGTGPRGAPRTGTVHPEHPSPDEPSA
ncbi:hypothetical protein ABZV75_29865 [Streptomyces flaveolus]|uniref:hypothetical protein n=1 Tax=Streptomyces flaveolus TaxID=67297 RepID=UPI0033A02D06